MRASRKLSLDKDVLSELESDELAQLAGGVAIGTLATCYCPPVTGPTCAGICEVTSWCTYNSCPTVPIEDCRIYINTTVIGAR